MKKVLWVGLVAGIVGVAAIFVLNPVLNYFFPTLNALYENREIFRANEDPLMALFFVYPIILGLVLSWIWNRAKSLFSGGRVLNGWNLGLSAFCVCGLPAFFINWSSFNFPLSMTLSWTIMSFVLCVVIGLVVTRLNK